MNRLQARINGGVIAKEIYEKQCRYCKMLRFQNTCGGASGAVAEYKGRWFSLGELKDKSCVTPPQGKEWKEIRNE